MRPLTPYERECLIDLAIVREPWVIPADSAPTQPDPWPVRETPEQTRALGALDARLMAGPDGESC